MSSIKTALYFGSFNPIHNGHIAIAGYIAETTDTDEVWFVVSPQNPLKDINELAPDQYRLEMVRLAIEPYSPKFVVCDIEMSMSRPSYTIDTVNLLKVKYPKREFIIIMGADSWNSISKWKDFKNLIANNRIFVYPRLGYEIEPKEINENIQQIDAPIIELSSTFIRTLVINGQNAHYFMPLESYKFMINNKIYK